FGGVVLDAQDGGCARGAARARGARSSIARQRAARGRLVMRALQWPGGDGAAVRDVAPPAAPDGWVLVDVGYCGLCGPDLHICAGEHPRAKPGTVLGHELSGRVASDAGAIARGTKVVVNPLLPCGT